MKNLSIINFGVTYDAFLFLMEAPGYINPTYVILPSRSNGNTIISIEQILQNGIFNFIDIKRIGKREILGTNYKIRNIYGLTDSPNLVSWTKVDGNNLPGSGLIISGLAFYYITSTTGKLDTGKAMIMSNHKSPYTGNFLTSYELDMTLQEFIDLWGSTGEDLMQ